MAEDLAKTAEVPAGMSMAEVFAAHRIQENLACSCTVEVLFPEAWEEHLSAELSAAGVPVGLLPAQGDTAPALGSDPESVMKQADTRLALAVALADPDGHALVAAIHERLNARI